jgi:hypothetical protein
MELVCGRHTLPFTAGRTAGAAEGRGASPGLQAIPYRDKPHDDRAEEYPHGDAWHRSDAHDLVEEPEQVNQRADEHS